MNKNNISRPCIRIKETYILYTIFCRPTSTTFGRISSYRNIVSETVGDIKRLENYDNVSKRFRRKYDSNNMETAGLRQHPTENIVIRTEQIINETFGYEKKINTRVGANRNGKKMYLIRSQSSGDV